MRREGIACLALVLLVAACAPGAPSQSSGVGLQSSAPKRLVAAIQGDPHTVYGPLNPSSNIPGVEDVGELLNAGLSARDNKRVRHPLLAEALPSLENGLWRLLPDGRMETTFRIRAGAAWHDGTAFTSDDLLFEAQVEQDRELPLFLDVAFNYVERVEAVDSRTVVVRWHTPYIKADGLFEDPMARHIVEGTYLEDKASFVQHPYFSRDFVGTGPYRLREWVGGSHLVVVANDQFVLGRPKVAEIEVKFIPDQNTLIANLLAGTVELTLGRGISLEQALEIRERWPEGRMDLTFTNFLALYPQFLNPNPPIVGNLQFRRALLHALNRQEMVEVLQGGLVPMAHSLVSPDEADYKTIEPSIVKYDYDPRKAGQMIETLGITRGPDGLFRDGAGQTLTVQLRVSATRDVSEKAILAAADFWQRVGVVGEPLVTPAQLARDREYRATYSGFELAQQPNELDSLDRYHSSKTPLPENGHVGANRARYRNPDFDALLDRYVTTIPRRERLEVVGQIIHHITDQVLHLSLFYGVEPTLMTRRLKNAAGRVAWDAYQWELG